MDYVIFNGSMGHVDEVLYEGTGDWQHMMDHVRLMGKHPDKYCRMALIDGATYVDFGSWSTFIKIDENLLSYEN